MFRSYEILFEAVFQDAAAGDDADEIVLVVHDGDEVLVGGDGDEVLHARVRAHGLYRAPRRSDLGDGVFLGLPDVHDAEPLERPEQIALGDDALIVPLRVEDGQRGIAGVFHALHRLPQRGIRVDIGAHRLGRQKEQDIHWRKGPPF